MNEFIKNIISVKLKHHVDKEYILDINIESKFYKDLFSDNNIVEMEHIFINNEGELYYIEYKYGLFKYGLNTKEQWWSSRTEVVNEKFNINIHECLINNCICGIDIKLEKYIINNFKLKEV